MQATTPSRSRTQSARCASARIFTSHFSRPFPNRTRWSPGVVYRWYSVGFTVGSKSFTLETATNKASLAYPTQPLPTFVLPPKKVDELRIIQGSCRKPHGESTDALEILDDLIAVDNDNPTTRPHLLLLGGDQIYADDVADDLLTAISDTAKKADGLRGDRDGRRDGQAGGRDAAARWGGEKWARPSVVQSGSRAGCSLEA